MACCLFAFSPDPIEGDTRNLRENTFQISLVEACYRNQPWCLCTGMFPCCGAYLTRQKVLDNDMNRYVCCQGYYDVACFRAGTCGERSAPHLCLTCESCFCPGPSLSSSRMFVADMYDIRPDPMDNRLIRFTNCLSLLSCVCDVAAIFDENLRHLARLIHVTAELVFYTVIGCVGHRLSLSLSLSLLFVLRGCTHVVFFPSR